jgi:hypothetical protein
MKMKELFCFIKNHIISKEFLVSEFKNEYWRDVTSHGRKKIPAIFKF